MASKDCNANVTAGFIDLATYDELEKYMYGAGRGGCAVSYFVRETKKSTWFTQIPVMLSIIGTPDFGQQWSAKISKSGDYLLNSWLQFKLPPISTASTTQIDTSLNPILSNGNISQSNTRWQHPLANVAVDQTTGDGGNGTGIQFSITSGEGSQVEGKAHTPPGAPAGDTLDWWVPDSGFTLGNFITSVTVTATGADVVFAVNANDNVAVGGLGNFTVLAPQSNAVLGGTSTVTGPNPQAGTPLIFAYNPPGAGPGTGFTMEVVDTLPLTLKILNSGTGYQVGDVLSPPVGYGGRFTVTDLSGLSNGTAGGSGYTGDDDGSHDTFSMGTSIGTGAQVDATPVAGSLTNITGRAGAAYAGEGYRVGDILRIIQNAGAVPDIYAYIQVDSILENDLRQGTLTSGVITYNNANRFRATGTVMDANGETHSGALSMPALGTFYPAPNSMTWSMVTEATTWQVELTNPGIGYRPGNVINIDGGPITCESIRDPAKPTEFETICRGLGGNSLANDLQITLTDGMFTEWYAQLEWCQNLAHNLIRECSLTCNDLVVARFDNYVLDFWTRFLVPYGKLGTYYNMIDQTYAGGSWDPFTNTEGPSDFLTLPLPFFFSRDSGLALPTGALPYKALRIRFDFRNWDELLILKAQNSADGAADQHVQQRYVPRLSDITGASAPTLRSVQVWGHYALVTNDERKRMNCARRQMLIEQTLTSPIKPFVPFVEAQPVFNLNMMHSIKMLFFAARNTTVWNDWSNYTTSSIVGSDTGYYARDPFENVTLLYEGTSRLSEMQINYFTQIQQYLYSPDTVASSYPTGVYFYSYAMDGLNVDPTGSTNYGRLAQVSIQPKASNYAIQSANPITVSTVQPATGWGNGVQRYEFVAVGVCNNVLLIDGGSMRFAVM